MENEIMEVHDAALKGRQDFIMEEHEEVLMEQPAPDIKVKHTGILNLPDGKGFDGVGMSHYISLAKKIGKGPVAKAINNISRWNKNDNPEISKKAAKLMSDLKNNKAWDDIPPKSESLDYTNSVPIDEELGTAQLDSLKKALGDVQKLAKAAKDPAIVKSIDKCYKDVITIIALRKNEQEVIEVVNEDVLELVRAGLSNGREVFDEEVNQTPSVLNENVLEDDIFGPVTIEELEECRELELNYKKEQLEKALQKINKVKQEIIKV